MPKATVTDTPTTADILHPCDVIRRLDELRRELLASEEAYDDIYEDGDGASEVCHLIVGGYKGMAHALSSAIVENLIPCSVESLAIKATLLDDYLYRSDVEAADYENACEDFAKDASYVFDPDGKELAVARTWGRKRAKNAA
jgi:hypothetical protein